MARQAAVVWGEARSVSKWRSGQSKFSSGVEKTGVVVTVASPHLNIVSPPPVTSRLTR